MDLQAKVALYHSFDGLAKHARIKADKLKDEIKAELPAGKHKIGEVEVEIQVKDRTVLDHEAAWALLDSKGYDYEEFCDHSVRLNESRIEEAYLDGRITDDDLRQIRKPQYSLALKTTKVLPDV